MLAGSIRSSNPQSTATSRVYTSPGVLYTELIPFGRRDSTFGGGLCLGLVASDFLLPPSRTRRNGLRGIGSPLWLPSAATATHGLRIWPGPSTPRPTIGHVLHPPLIRTLHPAYAKRRGLQTSSSAPTAIVAPHRGDLVCEPACWLSEPITHGSVPPCAVVAPRLTPIQPQQFASRARGASILGASRESSLTTTASHLLFSRS